jgi:hypothetical protein
VNDERIDELRQRLRALGYLDAGVDRFVLAPARGTRGPIALAARASLRVGLLGALLLGPAAAVGLGGRLPGLITNVRDAVVVSLYLAIVFFAAVTAVSFAVSLSAAAVAGARDDRFAARAIRVSAAAHWSIAIACLAYLTFWWRNANAGFGWTAPVWTTFALVVAVGISLLVGHAVRIATLAVLATTGGPAARLPRVPSNSWRLVIGGGLLAFAGAAAVLVLTAPSADARSASDRSSLTVVSTGRRIRLVAIDGFDRATFQQLRGSLEHFSFALENRSAVLEPQDTSDPARAWTTIATGVPPERHGVHAIETRRVAGVGGVLRERGGVSRLLGAATDAVRLTRPSLASRDDRQAKTIWEVAEDAGLRTAVVNWWASWPAPPSSGTVITDRAVLRLERGGALDGEIAPPAVYDELRAQWSEIRQTARAAAAQAFPTGPDAQTIDVLRRSAELDATIVGMAQRLPSNTLDLFVIYLPGLDIAQNALLGPAAGTLTPSAAAARVDALRSYYPFLDETAGPLLHASKGETVMLITQPGRVQTSGGGLFAVAPPFDSIMDAAPNSVASDRVTPLDVAPTIWHGLGVPLSRELPGRPVSSFFDAPEHPDRYIETYGRPFAAAPPRSGKPLDQEMIDRLRSLGYIK